MSKTFKLITERTTKTDTEKVEIVAAWLYDKEVLKAETNLNMYLRNQLPTFEQLDYAVKVKFRNQAIEYISFFRSIED